MKSVLSNSTIILGIAVLVFIIGKYLYMKPRFINGEVAPSFSGQLLDGSPFQLSDLRGKYVLLDFWGSWCPPCRAENPALVQLYGKFNRAKFTDASGFEIVSIGVEEDEKRWMRAIKRDNLNWPYHILDLASNLRFFDSQIAGKYSVKQLPSKYLINGDGRIIGVDLTAEEMDKLLTRKLEVN